MLSSPEGQIEYEIYLLSSQAESLLKDLDTGKAVPTFKENVNELKKISSILTAIIQTTEGN